MDRPGRFRKVDGAWRIELGRGWLDRLWEMFPDLDVRFRYEAPVLDLVDDVPEEFRDYQTRALEVMDERRWGRVAFATNAGKGAVIAVAARNAARAGRRTLVLADELSVFGALREELERWGGKAPDRVEAGADEPPDGAVVLAMAPTLRGRLKSADTGAEWAAWCRTFYQVLADEADRATADTWQHILSACENTEYRFGFSGSFPDADTVDDRVLEDSLGPNLIRLRNRELVRRGISAKPLVEIVPNRVHVPEPPRYWCDNHHPVERNMPRCLECGEPVQRLTGPARRNWVYEHGVFHNRLRHNLVWNLVDEDAANAVIVNRIMHGEALRDTIPDSVFLHGSHSKDEREDVLARFRRGDFQTLIATRILDRGTNLLGVAVGLVFASSAGSHRQTLQRIGRGLRRGDGKEYIYLRDIMDRGHQYLERAGKKRLRVYEDEQFDIRVREVSR